MNAQPRRRFGRLRLRLGLTLLLGGLLVFTLGADPGLFGLDRSPVVGFVQIAVMLVGLAAICLGGYMALNTLWEGKPKSIPADIGFRLVATGYVAAVTSAMADIFGFGSQTYPNVPYFGEWQVYGLLFGQGMILLGFVLLIPFPVSPRRPSPSESEGV